MRRRRLHLAGGDAAGQIVVQVEQGGGALLVSGQMQGGLRVLKEDVRVVLGLVEVEEAQGEEPSRAAARR